MNYVEGTTLIIGDTSTHLAHHGVSGQKWGVRRYQNSDGSLTALGRQRLGYTVKAVKSGITGAVKKTYALGKNTALGTIRSAKKVNAWRIKKKKEKASQSREGVMKNKKLFSDEELKKLNDRFDLEDQISLGGARKNAEIIGIVGDNADNDGDQRYNEQRDYDGCDSAHWITSIEFKVNAEDIMWQRC